MLCTSCMDIYMPLWSLNPRYAPEVPLFVLLQMYISTAVPQKIKVDSHMKCSPILLHDSILACANMAKGTLYELMISLQSLDLSSYPCKTLLWVLISENQHFSISFQNWDWGHLDKNKRRFGEHSKFGCNPSITQSLQHLPRGQSSPGNRQSGQHPSNGRRQIPHSVSSFATHLQIATAVQLLILTFMAILLVDTTEFCF